MSNYIPPHEDTITYPALIRMLVELICISKKDPRTWKYNPTVSSMQTKVLRYFDNGGKYISPYCDNIKIAES